MNEKNFADIEYSKKLGHLFQDADYWWAYMAHQKIWHPIAVIHTSKTEKRYPAITIQMALDKLPRTLNVGICYEELNIWAKTGSWLVRYLKGVEFIDKSLPNALCKMIEYLEESK